MAMKGYLTCGSSSCCQSADLPNLKSHFRRIDETKMIVKKWCLFFHLIGVLQIISGQICLPPGPACFGAACCGCPNMFYDAHDQTFKLPYAMLGKADCLDNSCLNQANQFYPPGSCERERYDAYTQPEENYGGVDLVFDINTSRTTSPSHKDDIEMLGGVVPREFMKRLVRQLRIGPVFSADGSERLVKNSKVGALCFFGNLTMHFGFTDFENIASLEYGITNMDLKPKKKAKPHKSFDKIREDYFGNSPYSPYGREFNRNLVLVFDDGVYSRQGTIGADNKFVASLDALKEVAEIFVVGVTHYSDKSKSYENARENWLKMASKPENIITAGAGELLATDTSDLMIDYLVFKTLQLFPKVLVDKPDYSA
ncbi:unnamed protein product [Owenia fusiformis]|uniref:Uncharacterized protein n=1 Tax=Owenia fusiformis TaxID=6347 RepID=A0A8J1UQW9_OWEFU|nr:unnamed protein product [Owenia fusiformis]